MNHRFSLFALALCVAVLVAVVGCVSTPTPVPTTEPPTTVPTALPQPTTAPTRTALPPSPTTAPTITLAPATNTPIARTPSLTPTIAITNTRPAVTRAPVTATATITPTIVAIKYSAPELVEPRPGDTRRLRKDAFVFRWNPVGDLAANECYQLRMRITHLSDPNRNYGEVKYLVESSCHSAVGSGKVEFVVNGRAPAPNYDGLVDEANGRAGIDSQQYLVEWDVTTVLNENGVLTPISPTSAVGQFTLLNQ